MSNSFARGPSSNMSCAADGFSLTFNFGTWSSGEGKFVRISVLAILDDINTEDTTTLTPEKKLEILQKTEKASAVAAKNKFDSLLFDLEKVLKKRGEAVIQCPVKTSMQVQSKLNAVQIQSIFKVIPITTL